MIVRWKVTDGYHVTEDDVVSQVEWVVVSPAPADGPSGDGRRMEGARLAEDPLENFPAQDEDGRFGIGEGGDRSGGLVGRRWGKMRRFALGLNYASREMHFLCEQLARLESGCGTRVWSYTDECRSMHEDMKEIYEKRECLHFDSSTARSFKFEVSHRSCSSTSENEQRDRETKQVLQFKISLFRAGGSSADRSLMGPLSLQHCQSSGTIGGSSAPTSAAPSTRASPLL
ncbi:unnamed protein product [Cyprideis torosa]|uniref:Uncharacterized protein n=1 Tax=Cyprideis torosa TaxID=163714 RepID=A0A7R8WKA6_9CRUS|nr:unnamed protein product [Cyprideis torosa]CAG0900242.1 unnamed protein product [Cyprideis torosa]